MRLWIVRHGASVAAGEPRFVGHADLPLSVEGQLQATLTAKYLRRRHFDAVITSDLQRAVATAEIIAQPQSLIIERDRDLREMSLGSWDGQLYAEIQASDPTGFAVWNTNPTLHTPSGGETPEGVQHRMMQAMYRYLARYAGGNVVWVSHNRAIRVFLCGILGMNLDRWHQLRIANCAITDLDVRTDQTIVRCLNCTMHLGIPQSQTVP